MNMVKRILILIIITCNLIICTGVSAENKQQDEKPNIEENKPKIIKHIIFITINGLNEQNFKNAYTPNIEGLAFEGVTFSAIGVTPNKKDIFIASLLTGCSPDVHGYTGNRRQLRCQTFPQLISKYGRSSALIFSHDAFPEFISTIEKGNIKVYKIENNENEDEVSKAIKVFKDDQPFFLGLNLSGIDDQLLLSGDKKNIAQLVNTIDTKIGRLFTTLKAMNVYDECMIVITGNCAIKETKFIVPVIAAGPGLKAGKLLPPGKIIDIVPTVSLLAGIQLPPENNGLVIWNAIKPGIGFVEENLLQKRVKDLSEENIKLTRITYQLEEEKQLVKVEKQNVDKEKSEIQDTIDAKDRKIKELSNTITVFKLIVIVTVILMGMGYVVEYYYLRKKFLMF